ncbi:MAG: MAPEG family protein [Proteobacteria bacterium]|nr:MAPEG family protein [Pseudomonadota bacterium]MBS0548520.1 MAPEG family protein [Pseudomonadota bacterium]
MAVFFICVGILGMLAVVLATRISGLRRGRRVSLGDGGDKELNVAIRAHGNLIEWAPLVLFLIYLLHGPYGPRHVAILAVVFTIGRLAHAGGMLGFVPSGRVLGAVVTLLVTAVAAVMLVVAGVRAI